MQEVEILQSVKFFSIDSLYNRSISSATRARMNGIVFSSECCNIYNSAKTWHFRYATIHRDIVERPSVCQTHTFTAEMRFGSSLSQVTRVTATY